MPEPAAVLDCAHLTRMTLGDRALAREVLAMFGEQSARLLAELAARPVPALAHTLKGSARGVGAWQVADAAHRLEQALRGKDDIDAAHAALGAAIADAEAAIADLLRTD